MTDPTVLLATCDSFPEGEPGGSLIVEELLGRGVSARWVAWDDQGVDWGTADLVAVRSTWDYEGRLEEFLAWAGSLGPSLVNRAEVLAWNTDKGYLVELAGAGLPVVPTVAVDDWRLLGAAIAGYPSAVVKPSVGAGGRGVHLVDAGTGTGTIDSESGPWIVQPLVESVRTRGEHSVFVLGGRAVSQAVKRPADGEIRVHEWYGGSTRGAPLDRDLGVLAERIVAETETLRGFRLPCARVDLMEYDDEVCLSELEVTEPGLYLDVLPQNAGHYAEMLCGLLGGSRA